MNARLEPISKKIPDGEICYLSPLLPSCTLNLSSMVVANCPEQRRIWRTVNWMITINEPLISGRPVSDSVIANSSSSSTLGQMMRVTLLFLHTCVTMELFEALFVLKLIIPCSKFGWYALRLRMMCTVYWLLSLLIHCLNKPVLLHWDHYKPNTT